MSNKLNILVAYPYMRKDVIEILNQNKEQIGSLNNIEIYPFNKVKYCESVFGTQYAFGVPRLASRN